MSNSRSTNGFLLGERKYANSHPCSKTAYLPTSIRVWAKKFMTSTSSNEGWYARPREPEALIRELWRHYLATRMPFCPVYTSQSPQWRTYQALWAIKIPRSPVAFQMLTGYHELPDRRQQDTSYFVHIFTLRRSAQTAPLKIKPPV